MISIGKSSEEAQESRFKDFKNFRQLTRKITRVETNKDLINILLVSSDPHITGLRKLPVKSQSKLGLKVLSLLKTPDISISSNAHLERETGDNSDKDTISSSDSDY